VSNLQIEKAIQCYLVHSPCSELSFHMHGARHEIVMTCLVCSTTLVTRSERLKPQEQVPMGVVTMGSEQILHIQLSVNSSSRLECSTLAIKAITVHYSKVSLLDCISRSIN